MCSQLLYFCVNWTCFCSDSGCMIFNMCAAVYMSCQLSVWVWAPLVFAVQPAVQNSCIRVGPEDRATDGAKLSQYWCLIRSSTYPHSLLTAPGQHDREDGNIGWKKLSQSCWILQLHVSLSSQESLVSQNLRSVFDSKQLQVCFTQFLINYFKSQYICIDFPFLSVAICLVSVLHSLPPFGFFKFSFLVLIFYHPVKHLSTSLLSSGSVQINLT